MLERPRASARASSTKPLLVGARCDVGHGRTIVVMPREFPHSRHEVWSLLTDPKLLSNWAPFTSDRSLAGIGRATLTMLDGGDRGLADIQSVVFVADALETLEYSWAEDTLSWMLEDAVAQAGGRASCRITLRQTLADDRMASAVAAGWHLCLDVAESVLDGHPTPPIRGMDAMDHGWAALNRRYARLFGVKPTRIG
jgi:uncharacterized protein YndB with AHSA1/START domain